MRAHHSRAVFGGIALAALLGLTACVQPASKNTSDTLAPLAIPPFTGSSVVAPGTDGTATTVTVDQNSVVTLATVITAPPAATSPASSTATTTTTNASGIAPNNTPGSYTVVSKDTVYGIARRCAITPQTLADYNTWSDGTAHPIYPGDVVKLPCTPSGSAAGVAPTSTTAPNKSASTTTTTIAPGPGGLYVVQAGDYLAGIAAKNGTTVDAIVAVNGWSDGAQHLIVAGQQIKLPAKTK